MTVLRGTPDWRVGDVQRSNDWE